MRHYILRFFVFIICFSCAKEVKKADENSETGFPEYTSDPRADFAIIIHGGAGTILKKNMTPEREAAYKAKLEEAIKVGYEILKNGGTSLDAVQKTINVMEDSPLFNAGKGSVFTNAETNELDASIMDGKTLNAGASAGTTTVRNPINLARVIMDKSPHVMMAGSGAETYAKEQGLVIVEPSYFHTERRLNSVKRAKEREQVELDHDDKTAFYDAEIQNYKFGTVGCAALDKNGNLAAGTSTGGMTNKRYGRVGDAPIIGAGTYANNNSCAVSSTGWGEYFIRAMVAHDISALMQYKGLSLKEAAQEVIQNKVPELGGDGGIVAVDKNGNMVAEFNTAGMYRATMNDKGELVIGIYKE
ncbi:isoaspartyl peptidase/L-asparaginase family protein [Psychroserpens luteolus]|uniref:isoaspartyl peptidase/L-asparaginase family protein n=1 Tax=Psychroserpens luteolus TaxID=2855840 RepID=UPI001E60EFE3|nr:isoaspartyl peptidase/L-asparaginase [Psychroserpens luteolus]MCD2258471.1 isoaspartyl peptidase/L-asparaginase [Psychroserpens luteolus]